jgi:hypothetical protein
VLLAIAPIIFGVGYMVTKYSGGLSIRAAEAYIDAGSLVAEALANMRTVFALSGGPAIVKTYAAVRPNYCRTLCLVQHIRPLCE